MAKKRPVKKKPPKKPPPSSLTMRLFAPGMSILHRAGLGGLACTLKYIERAWKQGALTEDELPGTPWADDNPPWTIERQCVTLNFGKPENAGEYLKRLFALAFQIKDGVIYLPGQYQQEPSLAVRAELQNGLTLTFLQHGRVRKLAKQPTVVQFDPVGDGRAFLSVEFKRCEGFKHQDGWKDLIDSEGRLSSKPVEVVGPLNPGAVVRHVAFTSQTKFVDSVELVLPLYFAIVGTMALSVNRGVGSLVAPDVDDLIAFIFDRPLLTPRSPRECRVAERSDAVMQARVRLRGRGLLDETSIPAFLGSTFAPTPWATQQKSRTWARHSRDDPELVRFEPETPSEEARRLDQFEVALALLAPRVRVKDEKFKVGKRRKKPEITREVAFWADSVVRPLIADNLAVGNAWYTNFTRLLRDSDAQGNPYRYRLRSEREALHTMCETIEFDYSREKTLVRAVHQAIRIRLAQIKQETQGKGKSPPNQATKNRRNRFREELRLSLVGAKTQDQCRAAICELFGKAGRNRILQEKWEQLLPLFVDANQWQKARDLALLALASQSYTAGDAEQEIDPDALESTEDEL